MPTRPHPHLKIIGGYRSLVALEYERARRGLQDAFAAAIRARGVPQGPEVDAAKARLDLAAEALRPPTSPVRPLPGILASDLKARRVAAEEAERAQMAQAVMAARRRAGVSRSSSPSSPSSSAASTPRRGA